jgi:hypothetical protein
VIANKAQRCLTLLRNDAFTDGVQYELRRIVQDQFLQNMAAMGFDGVEADVELPAFASQSKIGSRVDQ